MSLPKVRFEGPTKILIPLSSCGAFYGTPLLEFRVCIGAYPKPRADENLAKRCAVRARILYSQACDVGGAEQGEVGVALNVVEYLAEITSAAIDVNLGDLHLKALFLWQKAVLRGLFGSKRPPRAVDAQAI